MNKVKEVIKPKRKRDCKYIDCTTHLSIKKEDFVWALDDFSRASGFSNVQLNSPIFQVGKASFWLRFESIRWDEDDIHAGDNPDQFNIYLIKTKEDSGRYNVKYQISILGFKEMKQSEKQEQVFCNDNRFGKKLKFETRFKSLLQDTDDLLIYCKMQILSPKCVKDAKKGVELKGLALMMDMLMKPERYLLAVAFYLVVIYFILSHSGKPSIETCAIQYSDMHKLIVDSTHKLLLIVEALKSSEDKVICGSMASKHKFNNSILQELNRVST